AGTDFTRRWFLSPFRNPRRNATRLVEPRPARRRRRVRLLEVDRFHLRLRLSLRERQRGRRDWRQRGRGPARGLCRILGALLETRAARARTKGTFPGEGSAAAGRSAAARTAPPARSLSWSASGCRGVPMRAAARPARAAFARGTPLGSNMARNSPRWCRALRPAPPRATPRRRDRHRISAPACAE